MMSAGEEVCNFLMNDAFARALQHVFVVCVHVIEALYAIVSETRRAEYTLIPEHLIRLLVTKYS